MSNEIKKPIKRFTLPRALILFIIAMIIVPVCLLIYYISINNQLLTVNHTLNQKVHSLENTTEQLTIEMNDLIDERELVIERFNELDKIEEQLHQHINELPDEALGGIEIPLEDDETLNINAESSNDLLISSSMTDRYQYTIESIEQLEENLIYIPTHWPTEPNTITSPFGLRKDPFNRAKAIHSGIDVRGKTGTPIYAAADGVVKLAEVYGGYGNTIILNHGGRYETLYAHLSSIDVEEGDRVDKGDIIGKLGSTGRSTGPHLHYEVIKAGTRVDPELYLNFFDNDNK
ncbi:M23 family metallopeptidase [Amphibacillus sp. MSJ-3]|uniref:M23 family metallopeptidase n=1 Tax=Amphibacillus sp. MSJ-3 TaxID=2841505 RepID=UPI00209E670D|nr:M23 family metallopeptidase [Amphibacillus sp. MSJ-3]